MKTLIVIPARYASTRLPGKPLCEIGGKPMIQHVYEQAQKSKFASEVLIATDDERIVQAVQAFGGRAVMTSTDHPTGSDRLVEVALKYPADCYINVQGDEPFVDPDDIDKVIAILQGQPNAQIATLCHPITALEAKNENFVKVVFAHDGRALYFSRSPIPFARDHVKPDYFKHMGLYGYRAQALLDYPKLPASPLEQSEKLEQLRYLQAGYGIYLAVTKPGGPAVDTPACLDRARRFHAGIEEAGADLAKVKLLITDVDGVLSPAELVYDETGELHKRFNVRDGLGIRVLMAAGVQVAVVSGRDSAVLRKRMSDLRIEHFALKVKDKFKACNELMQKLGVAPEETLFIGDDTLDLPGFKACGLSCAVADAAEYIKDQATYALTRKGGDGAIREVVEKILEAKGQMRLLSTSEGYLSVAEIAGQ